MKRSPKYECSNCGAAARLVRCRNYPFTESGLKNVYLSGISGVRCRKCGNLDPIIPQMNDLMRMLVVAVAAKPWRLQGSEVRFLRKYLGMTGEEFGRLIHIDKSTLSKWENDDDPVGEQSDRLIRAVTVGLGEGLKEKIEQVMLSFPKIAGSRDVHIDMNCQDMSYRYATA